MTMDRRTLLTLPLALWATAPRAAARDAEILPLWPGEPPGGGGPSGPDEISPRGAVRHVARPTLHVFRPLHPTGAAMLVAAGGGYRRIETGKEAEPAARWLMAQGVTAFILSYRLPPEGWHAGPVAPLQDAQRALRLIRTRSADDGLDPGRLGVLGFSAGGHLMGLAGAWSDFAAYPPVDAADTLSARPELAALIYPVITLEPPYDRTSTRRALIGDHPTPEEAARWSVQSHVRADCPPVFLVQAKDDPVSNPENALIMAAACRRAGVSVTLHQLEGGGHGFAMGRPGTPSASWPAWLADWLRAHHMTG